MAASSSDSGGPQAVLAAVRTGMKAVGSVADNAHAALTGAASAAQQVGSAALSGAQQVAAQVASAPSDLSAAAAKLQRDAEVAAVDATQRQLVLTAISLPYGYIATWLVVDALRDVALAILPEPATVRECAHGGDNPACMALRPLVVPFERVHGAIASLPRGGHHGWLLVPAALFMAAHALQGPVRSLHPDSGASASIRPMLAPLAVVAAGNYLSCTAAYAHDAFEARAQLPPAHVGASREPGGGGSGIPRSHAWWLTDRAGKCLTAGLSVSAAACWLFGASWAAERLETHTVDTAVETLRSGIKQTMRWAPQVAPAIDSALTLTGLPTGGMVSHAARTVANTMDATPPLLGLSAQSWAMADGVLLAAGVLAGLVAVVWHRQRRRRASAGVAKADGDPTDA